MTFRRLLVASGFVACGGVVENAFDAGPDSGLADSHSSTSPDGGHACASDSDCLTGAEACGFSTTQTCAAGTCVPFKGPSGCQTIIEYSACACDGTDVSWQGGCAGGLPMNYAPKPILHLGSCAAACSIDSDCGQGKACAYSIDDGCSAQKECVDSMAVSGYCNSAPHSALACDGTCVQVQCGETAARQPLVTNGKTTESCDAGFH